MQLDPSVDRRKNDLDPMTGRKKNDLNNMMGKEKNDLDARTCNQNTSYLYPGKNIYMNI